jgi:hypothetical protein
MEFFDMRPRPVFRMILCRLCRTTLASQERTRTHLFNLNLTIFSMHSIYVARNNTYRTCRNILIWKKLKIQALFGRESKSGPARRSGSVPLPHGQISIKTPNPKCRLYWCLIEFIDCTVDTVNHLGIFNPSFELAPL